MSQLLFPLQGKPYLPLKGTQASSAGLVNMEPWYLQANLGNWRRMLLLVPFLRFNASQGFCHKLSAESLEMRKYKWAWKHRSRYKLTLIRTRLHMYAQCFDRGVWTTDLFFQKVILDDRESRLTVLIFVTQSQCMMNSRFGRLWRTPIQGRKRSESTQHWFLRLLEVETTLIVLLIPDRTRQVRLDVGAGSWVSILRGHVLFSLMVIFIVRSAQSSKAHALGNPFNCLRGQMD